jgi:hypothetical protein
MSDYNLAGLNSRSFEQLIQAISVKVFGPKTIVFGDGPDGGREATFEGPVPYPSVEDFWNGYGVVQAKFLQRPQGAPKDGEWAVQQLRDELMKFDWRPKGKRVRKGKDRRKEPKEYVRRLPDYYILVTNAVLTPVGDSGTKDKAIEVLEEFKKDKGLKGYDIWDYDKICAYLDGYEDIRHAYESFITTGDVLAEVMRWLRTGRADFEQVIHKFLQAELIADQYVNLEQAGRATEEKVPIARVFVDLPAYDEQLNNPPNEGTASALPLGFVAEIIEAAKSKLDPVSIRQCAPPEGESDDTTRPESGRFVLVGGPGQGKTTLGQFVCQLFRTSILKARSNWVPLREVEDILNLVDTQCQTEGLEMPTARRFPLRIVLSDFAKALTVQPPSGVNSVLAYVIARIKKRADEDITLADLRSWLKNYPWLVIFDGLDEVPASSNRGEVLEAIQAFRVEINELNAAVLITATTRPQGYSEDFAPHVFRHKWLAPLSATRALHYGRRLAQIRYSADKDRQEKVIARLERAANSDATARLMRSPLQVTIMTTLVGTRGQPPQERWGLFSEYYKVIYQREMERDIPASDILREYRSDIDRIHHRVGLILQARSERSGETDARLSMLDFAAVVDDRLEEEGHEGRDRDELQQKITEAATDRLVFLVGLQENLIGFEIRSLQEFMAAEALTGEREEVVRKRLTEIAPVSNWRNVFLFAAGRCFAERQDLRDTIYTLCAELNDSVADEVSSAVLEGSNLAMDILDEAVVRTQPRYARLFMRLALRALSLAPARAHVRLANLYDPSFEPLYREELSQRIESSDFHRSLGAWACLGRLIAAGVGWAQDLGHKYWPTESTKQLDVLIVNAGVSDGSWKVQKMSESVPQFNPRVLVTSHRDEEESFIFENMDSVPVPTWLRAVQSLAQHELALSDKLRIPVKLLNSDEDILSLTIYQTIGGSEDWAGDLLRLPSDSHEEWLPILAGVRFLEEPTSYVLARELKVLAGVKAFNEIRKNTGNLPWVLSACLGAAECAQDLNRLAELAEQGELGDQEDWEAAEKRWELEGVRAADLENVHDDWLPFRRDINTRGFPITAVNAWSAVAWKKSDFVTELLRIYDQLRPSRVRRHIAGWITFLLTVGVRRDRGKGTDTPPCLLTDRQLLLLLSDALDSKYRINLEALNTYQWETPLDESLAEPLDHVGRHAYFSVSSHSSAGVISSLSDSFSRHPDRLGILRLLSLVSLHGGGPTVPDELLDPRQYSDAQFRTAAILCRLARRRMDTTEAEQLADYVAENAKKTWCVEGALYMIESNLLPYDAALDRFLVTLLEGLPHTEWRAARRATKALAASLKRRTSGLDDNERWVRLGLRPRLNPLVTNKTAS